MQARAASSLKVTAYKVTLKTPSGDQVIECADDVYILDAAEEAGKTRIGCGLLVSLIWQAASGPDCSSLVCVAREPRQRRQWAGIDQEHLIPCHPVPFESFSTVY